jgi:hypothetical protein
MALVALALSCMALGTARAATPPAPAAAATIVLYDGSLGNKPDDQGFTFLATPSVPATTSGGATTLDTSAEKDISAGYFAAQGSFFGSTAPVPVLDRVVGYSVHFTVQVELEDHSSDDRAGFSLIVLSSDKRGIELGFWKDRIWAQEGGSGDTLFTQAEGAAFNTQSGRIGYTLAVQGDSYALSSGGTPILSGALRDYTAFSGQPDPYETPSLIFLGDDTSSASAKIHLAYVAVGPIDSPGLNRKVYLPLLTRL